MKIYDHLFINGRWVEPSGSETIDVVDPYKEELCGRVPSGTGQDVEAAVQAAQDAFRIWSMVSPRERAAAIEGIAAGLEARGEEIAQTISMELGTPISLSKTIQAGLPTAVMASYARIAAEEINEEEIGHSRVLREPVGVCGFITPWNFPLHQIVGKVAPALAAGCTMIVKPSSLTPLNAFILAEIIAEAQLPPGVFNLISGSGRVVGEALSRHPKVDLVSFTGSTRAGRRIGELAAQSIKRVTLELGGKSANVILDDADLKWAVTHGIKDICLNSGQVCSALSRMLVPAGRQAEAVAIARQAAEKIAIGDPHDANNYMGPLVSEAQRRKVRGYINEGIQEGANLVYGGPEVPAGLQRGYFVAPTIFSNVSNKMSIAQDEIFGPVLSIIPYKDDEEAVTIANDSIYGLSGAVWSRDEARARRIARRLRTGQVMINGGKFNPLAPFGGYKQSGHGRELGKYGLQEYQEIKSLQF